MFPDKLTFRVLIDIYRDLLLLEFVKNMELEVGIASNVV